MEQGAAILSNKLEFAAPVVLVSKLNPRIPRVWWIASDCGATSICSTEFLPLLAIAPAGTSWLTMLCSSANFAAALRGLAQGTSTSHQRVKPGDVLKLDVPVPSKASLEEAERVLSPLCGLAHVLRLSNRAVSSARDLLLPKLISGEIDLERAERDLEAAE